MNLSIIIPCYNESENIRNLAKNLFPVVEELACLNSVEVVFIDDGSTDETFRLLRDAVENTNLLNATMKFERLKGNWGLGKALRTGFEASHGEIIVTSDSDGTYEFSNIPALLAYLTDEVDIVTASPYHAKGKVVGVPAYRLLLSRGSSLIYRLLVDRRVCTYTCLFRAYRRRVIEDIEFVSNGFLSGTELIVKALLKGYRVAEYPAVLSTRVYGESKAKLLRTILAHLRFQSNVLLHRLNLLSLVRPEADAGRRDWLRSKYSYQGELPE